MKKSMYAAIGIVGVALGMSAVRSSFVDSKQGEGNTYFENAGIPDQSSNINETQLDNSKMVSEGSTYGVHYYNKYKDNE